MRYLNLLKNISNWPQHFRFKLGLTTSDPLFFTAKNSIPFEVPKRLYHEFKEVFLENAYTVGLGKTITKSKPTIIDIGANVGFFSVFALSKFPDCNLYAYEPIESNFKQLSRNRRLNHDKNFKCFNLAVCGHKGATKIAFDINDPFTTSASIIKSNNHNLTSIEVPCVRLMDIFDDHRIEKCDLLKLDCEGAEYDVLYNTPKPCMARIDQMAIEVHQGKNKNENLESLRDFLNRNDFSLFQFADNPHMLWAYRPDQ